MQARRHSTQIELPDVLLSVQRALVGQVSPKLGGACADLRDHVIVLTFYVTPDLSEERDDLRTASAMVIADFSDAYDIDDVFVSVSECGQPLQMRGTWVVLQRGFTTIGC
jgi:hypothetical protein